MKIFNLFKKKKRPPLVQDQSYDSTAYKVPQDIPFAGPETAWTTCQYRVPRFKQFCDSQFVVEAKRMAKSVDADVPCYMDKIIIAQANTAINDLESQRTTRSESIDEIIQKKINTSEELARELKEIKAEKERIKKIVEEIGGYNYV